MCFITFLVPGTNGKNMTKEGLTSTALYMYMLSLQSYAYNPLCQMGLIRAPLLDTDLTDVHTCMC